ncbi:hypothetical protein UK12_26200 [Saccharothrix sp. ST-888]|nr:hypothetical protein UK12_26200 [Saccharothrix sp. ST-888]
MHHMVGAVPLKDLVKTRAGLDQAAVGSTGEVAEGDRIQQGWWRRAEVCERIRQAQLLCFPGGRGVIGDERTDSGVGPKAGQVAGPVDHVLPGVDRGFRVSDVVQDRANDHQVAVRAEHGRQTLGLL